MKRLIQISNFLLVVVAVYFSVNAFYQFIESKLVHFDLNLPPAEPVATAEVQKARRLSDYDLIVLRDLFNTLKKTDEKKSEPKVDIDALRLTELNLKLWGTVSTVEEKSDSARAVIEEGKSRKQSLYKVGDVVQRATILEILRNSVVLDVDGRQEKLAVVEEKAAITESGIMSEEDRPIAVSRSQIDDAMKNVNDLMGQAKVKPLFQDGKPDGFILSSLEPTSIFGKMGLRSGDIITGINGQQIQSMDDALSFYKSLATGDRLSVQLKRRGRAKTIEFIIK